MIDWIIAFMKENNSIRGNAIITTIIGAVILGIITSLKNQILEILKIVFRRFSNGIHLIKEKYVMLKQLRYYLKRYEKNKEDYIELYYYFREKRNFKLPKKYRMLFNEAMRKGEADIKDGKRLFESSMFNNYDLSEYDDIF